MERRENGLELVTIGRSSIDLYGRQRGGRLEDVTSFAKYVGGSPTNTAVGAARLGLNAGLVTRVGADHMGRFLTEQLAREGVDTHGVIADPERLTALVILGLRDRDTFPLIFYRENCADMALEKSDLDPAWLAGAGAVLINGTHLSQPNVFAASIAAARLVREHGGRVVFDVDYRPVLWGLTGRDMGENRFVADAAVTARLQEVLPLCDLIVGTEEEIHILGGSTDTIAALRTIRESSDALLVCKRGALGCAAFPGAIPDQLDDGISGRHFTIEVFNVLGAGDAFMAGFLRGWLRDEPIDTCCTFGNACGALVVSRHGCAPAMPSWPELQAFLDLQSPPREVGKDAALNHLHWATTRTGDYQSLTVLAVDHRSQFEDLAAELGIGTERVPRFKQLALDALDRIAGGRPGFGVLLDGRFGEDALARTADMPYWVGRPIELPKSRPLEFESSADVATELDEWPRHQVVKCLVFYHPDDEPALRERQERQVLRLFDACRKTGHELLLEVIVPAGAPTDAMTVARAIRRLYALGVKPDWWKLEPVEDDATWANIDAAIRENDPWCRGIVLLGLSAPMPQLIASLEVAASHESVRGFAVGRTIFYDVARDWLTGAIDDDAAVEALAGRLSQLVETWRAARERMEKAR
jgi:5-dehydro-2-deoxygluconokinase